MAWGYLCSLMGMMTIISSTNNKNKNKRRTANSCSFRHEEDILFRQLSKNDILFIFY